MTGASMTEKTQQCDGAGALLHSILNAPRLSARLRASLPTKSNITTSTSPTIDAIFQRRAAMLAERRRNSTTATGTSSSFSRAALIEATLGDWKSSPKPARAAFDAYIQAIASLLGGLEAGDAVIATATAAWRALLNAPPLTEQDVHRRGASNAELQRAIKALQPVLGQERVRNHASIAAFLPRYVSLYEWHRRLAPPLKHTATTKGADKTSKNACTSTVPIALPSPMDLDWNGHTPSPSPPSPSLSSLLATMGLGAAHPAAELLLAAAALQQSGHGSQASQKYPPFEQRRASTSHPNNPPAPTEAEVKAIESEVFGANKSLGINETVGARWLRRWCNTVVGVSPQTPITTSGMDVSLETSVAVLVLRASLSDDILASELFDLLGENVFDSITTLLDSRRSLMANISALIATLRSEDEAVSVAAAGGRGPSYGPTVTVVSESEKVAMKAERKAEKKRSKQQQGQQYRGGGGGGDGDGDDDTENAAWLSRYGLAPLIEAELDKEDAAMKIRLGDGMEFRLGEGAGSRSGVLPTGSKRTAYKGYEEVLVPPIPTGIPGPNERFVRIEELPSWTQLPFAGYTQLNRIQSRIFSAAFYSNENMLVCAPTGAGKTNIAMIAVLREVGQHMGAVGGGGVAASGLVIHKNEFKIVYVAPMKALAAEVTASFAKRLEPLGLAVRELTGDMQLSKREMEETQMIVTTPEKWDVITRKGGEVSVAAAVKLLIIDEVHLLNDERGPVIETLVARTSRQVETSQSMIRIVGLSATLPNYKDVGTFLGVNHSTGLFYFDASYRPVPLQTAFVGVSEKNFLARSALMDEITYQKVVDAVKRGHQAMVFVHSRKDTGKTARMLALKAQQNGETALFDCSEESGYPMAAKDAKKSRNKELTEVFESGIGLHHAGMLRADRSLVERLFGAGHIKVLCCTATLAWGVNLPAHTVIIKGTQLYNPQKGGFTDLGMLDVQQIFGRAGRPQFQDSGEAVILTTHDKLAHYLGMLTHAVPIESQFTAGLADHLNAEIVLGTVTNVSEAVTWLGYTYLYVRMAQNPLAYGIAWEELARDHRLEAHRRRLIIEAARELERSKMARFDERSGNLYVTDLGRVASHFYIRQCSIEVYNGLLKPHMTADDIFSMMSQSSEFENLAVRDEELLELDQLARSSCPFDPRGGSENKHGKANILLQTYISRARLDSFSLIADTNYVAQNAPRLARALFEICLRRGWPSAAELCMSMAKSFEARLWPDQHPLWQFEGSLKHELIRKLEERGFDLEQLRDMRATDIGAALRHPAAGPQIAQAVNSFPTISVDARLHPITRTVLRVELRLTPEFQWRDGVHGAALRWLIWVEDSETERIYHSETWSLTKKMWKEGEQTVTFAVPINEPLPPQYYIKVISDSWLGAEYVQAVSFKGLILPEKYPPHTELLDLDPLPVSALQNSLFETLYRPKFTHFNPIQTQAFHTLYHTDENVLLGAPTGSGKTISAELTLLRLFTAHPGSKAVYIAPLKALVRERIKDWSKGFCAVLGKRLVELTGDFTPDIKALLAADVIVATPEKWDGISRNWQTRTYVRQIGLIIMDEIHLLGADRGPILEVIVSRMRHISTHHMGGMPIRFVGLSTALANASDLADWLGVPRAGLFNFKPSVRPVPLEAHIQGYPGKFYCPRMATMNKPCYAAIQTHSPTKPVLIFVASRRQTRLTALDLIAYAAADLRPRAFLRISDDDMDQMLPLVKDSSLRHTLQFGVGLHHAGLGDGDRSLVERLFVQGRIQVLVATSTLAWGVNTPAHLVIVKGTEFYDAPSKRYVDYPITDVLQMMGRAGRPQYDKHGVAVIMVHEPKKSFYKKFLYEPFPVESSLPGQLADHLNAEIVGGSITCVQDAIDYLTWTFFLRRLVQNPSYYDLESVEPEAVNAFLSSLVMDTLEELTTAGCVQLVQLPTGGGSTAGAQPDTEVRTSTPGRIASLYYLRHATMGVFSSHLGPGLGVPDILKIMCAAAEYNELPVRHNEDQLNAGMVRLVRHPPPLHTVDDPHTKTSLLLQAHMSRLPLPISDYVTDTKSVLDNSLRILQAIVDVAADGGWGGSAEAAMRLAQSLMQGLWYDEDPVRMLPGAFGFVHASNGGGGSGGDGEEMSKTSSSPSLKELVKMVHGGGAKQKGEVLKRLEKVTGDVHAAYAVLERLPLVEVSAVTVSSNGTTTTIEVKITRTCGGGGGRNSAAAHRAFAPLFPKIKEEGWWLMAVEPGGSGDMVAMKRVSMPGRTGSVTKVVVPAQCEAVELRLVSDSYLGLDARYLHRI